MQLSTAIFDFLEYLKLGGKAKATRTAYESDLMLLLGLAGVHGGNTVLAFTPALVRDYFLTLSRRGLAMTTLHRRRASISEFAKWGLRHRLWVYDPMAQAPKIRRPRHLPRPFTHEEHDRLMALPLHGAELTLRSVLYYGGLRIEEALSLRLKDALLGDDDRPATMRVRGKGGKERVIPMFPELRAILYDDFLARPAAPITDFVVARSDGRRWTYKMARRLVTAWGKAATVTECECHRWRHTCGSHLHEMGWQLRDIADFLGHADVSTTMLYTQVTPKKLMESAAAKPLRVIRPGSIPPPEGAG